MFKILKSRQDDPGFDDAVIIVNQSQFWLSLTDDGHQIPPVGIAALDSGLVSSSNRISGLVANNRIVILDSTTDLTNKPKKKKRAEIEVLIPEAEYTPVEPLQELDNTPIEINHITDTVVIVSYLENEPLVAESTEEKQVSSNKNIVNQN